MKSTNFIIQCLLLATLLLFSGCGNEEKTLPSGEAVRLINKMYLYESYIDKNKSRLSADEDEYEDRNRVEVEYRYDELNRVTEVITSNMYSSLTMTVYYPDNNTVVTSTPYPSADKYIYKLNDDGHVILMADYDFYKTRWLSKYEYVNGYLQKIVYPGRCSVVLPERLEECNSYICTYIWESGNIKTEEFERTFWTVPSQPVFVTTTTETYEYGSVKYIPIPYVNLGVFNTDFHPFLRYGKPPQNMPSKVTTKSANGFEYVVNFRYETDTDGYPIKIYEQRDSDKEKLRAVIEYKDLERYE